MAQVHATAIVSKSVELGKDVVVGPYSVLLGKAKIGDGTHIENHVTIGSEHGRVSIGRNNLFLPGAVVGGPPQDLSFKGDETFLEIGDGNTIRECCTVNVGTVKGGGVTRIGNNNLIMAYSHVAHDCQIGNHVVIANGAQFAGHVIVEDRVVIGGGCMFSQFLKVGKFAYIAGDTTANKDIAPFTIAEGKWAVMRATNKVGLERAGFAKDEIDNIKRAIRLLLMGDRTINEAVAAIKDECTASDNIRYLLDFIVSSEKGLAR